MPSMQLQAIVDLLRADPLSRAPTLLHMRAQYEAGAAQFDLPDIELMTLTAGSVAAEWISRSPHPTREILFLHGGGYVIGSIATHRMLAASLAREADARVLAIDYRRAP